MPAKRGKNISSRFGAKWIRKEKRLAIYIRDNFTCLWCNKSIKDNGLACIDHLVPDSSGERTNDDTNLITACRPCNDRRGNMPVEEFIATLAKSQAGRKKIHQRILAATSQMLGFHKDAAKKQIQEKGYQPLGVKKKPDFAGFDPADFK